MSSTSGRAAWCSTRARPSPRGQLADVVWTGRPLIFMTTDSRRPTLRARVLTLRHARLGSSSGDAAILPDRPRGLWRAALGSGTARVRALDDPRAHDIRFEGSTRRGDRRRLRPVSWSRPGRARFPTGREQRKVHANHQGNHPPSARSAHTDRSSSELGNHPRPLSPRLNLRRQLSGAPSSSE
jgi:hypothetical protein